MHRVPAGLGECHYVQDKTRSAFIEAVYVSVKPVICEIFSLEISIIRAIRFDKWQLKCTESNNDNNMAW